MLIKTSNKIDAVAAANDGLANAVVVSLKQAGLKPIPLSGQDATTQGVQNIISGWQTMTVFKDVRKLATATAGAAIKILKGQAPPTTGTVKTKGRNTRAGLPDPAADDQQVELADPHRERFPEEERHLHRHLQAVLLVGRRSEGNAVGRPSRAPHRDSDMNKAL